MRVLVLTTVYPSAARPTAGPFNRSLAEALAAAHEVKVVAPVPWPIAVAARLKGTPSAASPLPTAIEVLHPLYLYPPSVLRNWHGWFLRASIRATVRSLLARFRPDAVIGYWAHPDGEATVEAAREAGAVSLIIVGGSDVLMLAEDPGRRAAIVNVLTAADAILAVGSVLQDRVVALGVPRARVHVYQQGVDLELFSPGHQAEARRRLGLPPAQPVVVWIGRMVPVKGLDVLIAACARLRASGLDFGLYLIGDGPLAGQVRSWIRSANGEGFMHIVGPVPHDALPDWYRAADLTVLSSHSEGIPNVLRESLACGTPFVATRVGGVAEIAPDRADLVPPADPEALAAAMERRLSSTVPAASGDHGQASWADTAAAVAGLIRSLRER